MGEFQSSRISHISSFLVTSLHHTNISCQDTTLHILNFLLFQADVRVFSIYWGDNEECQG